MSTDLERRLRETLHEDAQRARLVNPDRPSAPGVASLSEPPLRARSGRRLVALAAAIVLIAAAAVVAINTAQHRTTRVATTPTTVTPTTLSVVDQTRRLGHILFADLPGSSHYLTSIDSSAPGVITITGLFGGNAPMLVHESQLATAGTESGLWTAADAARMVHTRAGDGMVRSASGKTTWTFRDGGLQIVARVP